jgi:hypothetical protein
VRPNEPPRINLRFPAISSIEQVVLLMADGARRTRAGRPAGGAGRSICTGSSTLST